MISRFQGVRRNVPENHEAQNTGFLCLGLHFHKYGTAVQGEIYIKIKNTIYKYNNNIYKSITLGFRT